MSPASHRRIAAVLALGGAAALGALGVATARHRVHTHRLRRSLRARGPPDGRFDPESVADLPPPARRYLRHAIAPRRPLARSVALELTGSFRGEGQTDWSPIAARQVLSPGRGFVWEARLSLAPGVWLSGADWYADGRGGQRFALLGLLPVVRASGPAVSRSAAGRLLGESVFLPAALLPGSGAEWDAVDDRRARVALSVDDLTTTLTLVVAESGALRRVEFDRPWAEGGTRPFRVAVDREQTVAGFTVPATIRAGWGRAGDYREFYRVDVSHVVFR